MPDRWRCRCDEISGGQSSGVLRRGICEVVAAVPAPARRGKHGLSAIRAGLGRLRRAGLCDGYYEGSAAESADGRAALVVFAAGGTDVREDKTELRRPPSCLWPPRLDNPDNDENRDCHSDSPAGAHVEHGADNRREDDEGDDQATHVLAPSQVTHIAMAATT